LIGTGGESDHWDGSNLRERMEEELADLIAACKFVIQHNCLDSAKITERTDMKLELFNKWQGSRK